MTHITGQLSGAAGRGPVLGHGALLAQAWKPVERPGEAGPASLSTSGMSYSVLGAGGGGDSLALYRSMSSKYVPQLAAPACHVSRVFTSGAVRSLATTSLCSSLYLEAVVSPFSSLTAEPTLDLQGEHSPDVAALTPAVYPPAADAVLCSARSILVAPVYLGPAAEGRPDAGPRRGGVFLTGFSSQVASHQSLINVAPPALRLQCWSWSRATRACLCPSSTRR